MPLRPLAFLLILAAVLPAAAAGPVSVSATSSDCVTQLAVVFGPHVPGACTAAIEATLDVACGEACVLRTAGTATGTSLVPAGAGVFGWVVWGNVAPCQYAIPFFAQGLPPCGPDAHYTYLCSGVVEPAGSVTCAGAKDIPVPTAPGACTSLVVGSTGYGRLRAPPSPSPPPFTVLVYDSAFAQAHYRLDRAADGTPSLAPGMC